MRANIEVHAAQRDSVMSACGMSHVSQTPLLADVTCHDCFYDGQLQEVIRES